VSFLELVKIMMDSDLRAVGLVAPGEGEEILKSKNLAWIENYDRLDESDGNGASNHRLLEATSP
jgi:hypothetical protein